MKMLKIALAAAVAFGFLAAGCAEKTPAEQTAPVKETTTKNSNHYSSKLGTQSTKKDTKK